MTAIVNNPNHYGKRTAAQVNAILKAHGIEAKAENLGEGRTFDVRIESTLKNRYTLKKAGFILCTGNEGDKFITIKAY